MIVSPVCAPVCNRPEDDCIQIASNPCTETGAVFTEAFCRLESDEGFEPIYMQLSSGRLHTGAHTGDSIVFSNPSSDPSRENALMEIAPVSVHGV